MLFKHGSLSDSLLFKGPCKFLLTNIKLIYYIPIFQTIYSYLQNKISELFTGWLTVRFFVLSLVCSFVCSSFRSFFRLVFGSFFRSFAGLFYYLWRP